MNISLYSVLHKVFCQDFVIFFIFRHTLYSFLGVLVRFFIQCFNIFLLLTTFFTHITQQNWQIRGQIGSPETPLSDLGKSAYVKYWKSTLLKCLNENPDATIEELSKETCMTQVKSKMIFIIPNTQFNFNKKCKILV